MNWLRKLLGLHVHEWGRIETVTIPPGTYVSDRDPKLTLQFMGRTMKVRWCRCGTYKNIYS